MADEFNFQETRVEWDERHATILKNFLDNMEAEKVRYVILKNDSGLPYKNYSKDVDIVIEPGSYKKAAKLLRIEYENGGITNYKIHKFERLRCWYGFDLNARTAIHIDLLEGFLHKGFEMFPFEIMYKHAYKNVNGVYVLDSVFSSLVLLLHSTICYHHIKDKYVDRIKTEYNNSKAKIDTLIKCLFPTKAATLLIELLEQDDYVAIEKKAKVFSLQSKKLIFFKRPIFSIINVFDFLWEKVCRLVFNSSKYNTFISVHAPDGTGKTTFIQSLSETLGFYYVCNADGLVNISHFRPEILPNLGAAGEKAGIMKQDKNFTVPHRAKPAGFISSFIRMTYYWLDYVIGVPLILRKSAQFDKITIFDRYIYDFLVDPLRSRIKLPYWIRRTFTCLVKHPKVVFVLDTDADTIYARKQELAKDEINRQLIEFRKLSKLGDRVHFLNASQKPEDIANDATKVIIDIFTHKL